MKNIIRFIYLIDKKNLIKFFSGSLPGACSILFSCALFGISVYLISICSMRVGIEVIAIPVVLVRFFGIGRALLRYLERLYTHDMTFKLIKDLRVATLKAMTGSLGYLMRVKRSSDTISALISDVERLEEFYLRVMTPVLTSIFVYISLAVFLGILNTKVFLVFLTIFAMASFFSLFYGLTLGSKNRTTYFKANKNVYHELNSAFLGLMDIIANSAEKKTLSKINETLELEEALGNNYKKQSNFTNKMMGLMSGIGIILAIIILGLSAQNKEINYEYIGTLAIIVFSSFEVLMPIGAVSAKVSEYLYSLKNIFNIMDAKIFENEKDSHRNVHNIVGEEIKIGALSYTYDSNEDEKRKDGNIKFPDFGIKSGQIKVLKGSSGAGKSTLLNILIGLNDEYKGSAQIDGYNINDIKRQSLYANISYLRQKPHFFNTSIRNNLKIAREDISEDDILKAIEMVGMTEYIKNMSMGIDTVVGEFGTNLSGGELRRLAIAREILKDTGIMLLDEPFAWLDMNNEKKIMNLLISLAKDGQKAILIASHSLLSEEGIDEIIKI